MKLLDRLCYAGLLLLVVLAPLPLGSNREWSWSLAALVAALLTLAWLLSRLAPSARVNGHLPLFIPALFAVTCAWIVLQAVSWTPASWHHPLWQLASENLRVNLPGRVTLSVEDTLTATMRLRRDRVWLDPFWSAAGRGLITCTMVFLTLNYVNRPGVHLAPAGITIKELIDEYCGGMQDGHRFYGYFPGGASGGILPASLGDIPLDFDTLQEFGCFIGSAAVVVLSDQDSAKQAALNSLRFFAHESCGQCTPCRVGCEKAVSIMESGDWDIDQLQDLSDVMIDASICGLGQAAPNPIMSVIKYFPHELGIEEDQ